MSADRRERRALDQVAPGQFGRQVLRVGGAAAVAAEVDRCRRIRGRRSTPRPPPPPRVRHCALEPAASRARLAQRGARVRSSGPRRSRFDARFMTSSLRSATAVAGAAAPLEISRHRIASSGACAGRSRVRTSCSRAPSIAGRGAGRASDSVLMGSTGALADPARVERVPAPDRTTCSRREFVHMERADGRRSRSAAPARSARSRVQVGDAALIVRRP